MRMRPRLKLRRLRHLRLRLRNRRRRCLLGGVIVRGACRALVLPASELEGLLEALVRGSVGGRALYWPCRGMGKGWERGVRERVRLVTLAGVNVRLRRCRVAL